MEIDKSKPTFTTSPKESLAIGRGAEPLTFGPSPESIQLLYGKTRSRLLEFEHFDSSEIPLGSAKASFERARQEFTPLLQTMLTEVIEYVPSTGLIDAAEAMLEQEE